MDIILTDTESRVLGCLLEKEMATPDYYPLTLNALTNACNQKSNRNPVVFFDEGTVIHALAGLQERKMVRQSNVGRVTKYEQIFSTEFKLLTREAAAVCILLLRGPQTIGEIRNRTERLYAFNSLQEVEETLSSLEDIQLVAKLSRQPGRKESRYAHLLSGVPTEGNAETVSRSDVDSVIIRKKEQSIAELQEQIDDLRRELLDLRLLFESFTSQFD